jgi:hypothetical protein
MKKAQYVQIAILALIIISSISFSSRIILSQNKIVPSTVLAAISGAGSGLTSYYTFDSGTASDSVGSANGTLSGGITSAAGKVGGGALSFSGNGSISATLQTPPGSLSVSAWVNPSITTGHLVYLGDSTCCLSYELNLAGGRAAFSFVTTAGANPDVTVTSNATIPTNTWSLVTAVYNSSAGTIQLYVNGSLDASGTRTGSIRSGTALRIGSRNPADDFFSGSIDDVRIYNAALTAQDVSDLYVLGGGSAPTPVAGICSATTNVCTSGSLSDLADTQTQNQWQCLGVNGGANSAICTSAISQTQVNGICGTTAQNICTAGTFLDLTDTATNYVWQCTGSNGGSSPQCTFPIPQAPPAGGDVYFNSNCSTNGNGASWACASSAGGTGAFNNTTTVGGKTTSCLDPGSYAWKRGVTNWFAGSDTKYTGICIRNDSGTGRLILKKPTASNHGTDVGWQSSYETKQAILDRLQTEVANVTLDGSYRAGPESGYGMKVEHSGGNVALIGPFQNGDPAGGMIIKYIEITNNTFDGGDADAISFFGPGGNLVQYNWVHDISGLCFKSANAVGGKGGFSDTTFEYNVCGKIGLTTDPQWHNELMKDDAGSRNVTIRNNLFYDWKSTGGIVLSENQTDWKIYNNVFTQRTPGLDCGNGVITGLGSGAGNYHDIHVFNNTFANISSLCAHVFTGGSTGDFSVGTGNEVRNNLFYNVANVANVCGGSGSGCAKSNNWYYLTPRYTPASNEFSGSGNPFVNSAAENFHLAAGAGPIDKGTTQGTTMSLTSFFTTDNDGNPRSGTWDIGAYEFGGPVTPINGSCSATVNQCTAGSLLDQADSATEALWQCTGSNGGSTASCSLPLGSAYKPGDFNNDGAVNSLDYSLLAGAWNTNSATYDLNKDGTVNTLDYSIMARNWTS